MDSYFVEMCRLAESSTDEVERQEAQREVDRMVDSMNEQQSKELSMTTGQITMDDDDQIGTITVAGTGTGVGSGTGSYSFTANGSIITSGNVLPSGNPYGFTNAMIPTNQIVPVEKKTSKLPEISFRSEDNAGKLIKMILKPESNIDAFTALKLAMLMHAYNSNTYAYSDFSPYKFVCENNLERHFKFEA